MGKFKLTGILVLAVGILFMIIDVSVDAGQEVKTYTNYSGDTVAYLADKMTWIGCLGFFAIIGGGVMLWLNKKLFPPHDQVARQALESIGQDLYKQMKDGVVYKSSHIEITTMNEIQSNYRYEVFGRIVLINAYNVPDYSRFRCVIAVTDDGWEIEDFDAGEDK